FFVGYSTNSKAFRVFNSRTRIVEENLHVQFGENIANIAGCGPNWLFDIDALIKSINYKPIVAWNQSNGSTCTKACDNVGKARIETIPGKDYILLPLFIQDLPFSSSSKDSPDVGFKPSGEEEKKDAKDPRNESGNLTEGKDREVSSIKEPRINQENDDNINSINNISTASDGNSTNNVNDVSSTVNAAGSEVNVVDPKTSIELPNDPNMPELKDIQDDLEGVMEIEHKNISWVSRGKGLLGPKGRIGGKSKGRLGEDCGGRGGRGVSKDGRGGGGLVVDGGRSSRESRKA
ncbi:hypothetical protein Tco_0699716, partial [Tanacetum coccineum]